MKGNGKQCLALKRNSDCSVPTHQHYFLTNMHRLLGPGIKINQSVDCRERVTAHLTETQLECETC